jgi:6-pyruvoyltetrahydropterin/6-carboxytetrahydropterin synthase
MPSIQAYIEFRFEAAHFLPNVPEGHKCKKMHGHSYIVTVYIEGEVNSHTGWVLEFEDVKKAFVPILQKLDHSVLNEIEGLENPTVEILAIWIWNKLLVHLPQLSKIAIAETSTSGCVYEGR